MFGMSRTLLIVFASALVACGSDGNDADAAVDLGRDLSIPMAGELASAQTLTHCLAVDATSVFWADQGSGNQVLKVSKSGGTPTAVIDATNAYFTDDGDSDAGTTGDVLRAPLAGTTATQLATQVHPKSQLATDGSYVYFITDQYGPADMMSSGKDALVRMPVGGGSVDVLYMDLTSPEAEELFVDAANVYYSDGTAVTARAKAGGGAPLTFGMGSLHGTPFVTDGTRLVMVESTGIGQGSLVLYRVDGTGRTVLSATTATPLAVDDSGVYANQAGHLVRISLDGKSTTQLTTTGPRALAVDADSLYFTDGAAILKLAK
jgi:sugar lactone lactonase YvrE